MTANCNNSNLYGGDDIGAVVIDVGSYSVRVGYAQEDFPTAEIPSVIGVHEQVVSSLSASMEAAEAASSVIANDKIVSNASQCGGPSGTSYSPMSGGLNVRKNYYVDLQSICVPKEGARISSFMRDGMIDDWDLFEKVLDYGYAKCLKTIPDSHPVLMSEFCLNTNEKREKLMELMFEKYHVPAFYVVKAPVLSAFFHGRSSGMVVDSGYTHTCAVPVYDGHVLTRCIVKTPLGGEFLTLQCKQLLQDKRIDIIPAYMIKSKQSVKENEKPIWTKKTNLPDVTPSFHNYMVHKVVEDFQQCVLQVSDVPLEQKFKTSDLTPCHYEFPNGYNENFAYERYRIAESMFNPNDTIGSKSIIGVSDAVRKSVSLCDIDTVPVLYGNLIVTGGNSFISGFNDRLNKDLHRAVPKNVRLKIISNNNSAERRFSSWIGGSILASTGTFQQLWISKVEYAEFGTSQLERKCP